MLNWFPQFDFSGGENVDVDPDNLQDNEVMKAENVDFVTSGGFKTRLGCAPINATSYQAQVEQVFEWVKQDGTTQLMAVIGNKLYKISGDTKTEVQTLDSATKVFHISFLDKLFFGNGNNYYYYNGTNCYTVKTSAPSTTPTVGSSGNGSFTGTWLYKVSFVNSAGFESELSASATTGAIAEKAQIDLTNIPLGSANVSTRKIYRTKNVGSDYYYLATISNNTATTYTDTTTDSKLVALFDSTKFNVDNILKCKYSAYHNKSFRWFFSGNKDDPEAVYYTEPNEPTNVNALSVLYPTHGMGEVNGIRLYNDALIAGYEYGALVWRGVDPSSDAEWQEVPIPEGFVSNDSISLVPGSMTYLSRGGWHMISPSITGYNVTMDVSQSLIPNFAFGKQTKTITAITTPNIACSVYDPQTGYLMLAYTKEAAGTRNNRVLVNLWGTNCFWHYTGWNVNDWCRCENGDVLFATNNYIMKIRSGANDNGVAISQRVECKKSELGIKNNYKIVGKLLLRAAQRSEDSTVNIQLKYGSGSTSFNSIQLNESIIWSGNWSGRWGLSELNVSELNFDPALTGEWFQLIYTNSTKDEAITIYGHAMGYLVKSPIGKKVS